MGLHVHIKWDSPSTFCTGTSQKRCKIVRTILNRRNAQVQGARLVTIVNRARGKALRVSLADVFWLYEHTHKFGCEGGKPSGGKIPLPTLRAYPQRRPSWMYAETPMIALPRAPQSTSAAHVVSSERKLAKNLRFHRGFARLPSGGARCIYPRARRSLRTTSGPRGRTARRTRRCPSVQHGTEASAR